jgi:uncharacterized protein (TIGR00288 family)
MSGSLRLRNSARCFVAFPADRVRHGEVMDARRRSGPGTESHVTPPSNRPSRHLPSPSVHAPNAALLIDFDNVTLGIRSDLTKELRTLLNSDIIKGKVAVQRAYADWRRYPQYIVPLSESSIDLIFAPAFGTSKKNATDIRLAIDAIELVFTRPEIGTFIIMSGDSDFSTMVIKLKEYGKYVVGVGIRESASDLLIQNCDEYYSYSDLAGLTKEVDTPSAQRDPWELARDAVAQMVRNSDVMRSDRLKQVMQQIDPNFDEKNAGFSRFSKFVIEAGQRGVLQVTKMDNGQYEVAPAGAAPVAPEPSRNGPREAVDEGERRGRSRGRGRGRGRERDRGGPGGRPAAGERAPVSRSDGALTLAAAFQLIGRALSELKPPVPHEALRLRMVALRGREDALLQADRFIQLLRQANDAEVADVRKVSDTEYEIAPHRLDGGAPPPPPSEPSENAPAAVVAESVSEAGVANGQRAGLRFRRGSRGSLRVGEIPLIGVVQEDAVSSVPEVTVEEKVPAKPARPRTPGRKRPTAAKTPPAEPTPAGDTGGPPAEAAAPSAPSRRRRPSRPRARKPAE